MPYAEFFSTKLAACEAIWSLIHNGLLIPGDLGHVSHSTWAPAVETNLFGRCGGDASTLGIAATYPGSVLPAPSLRINEYRSLTDGDLFLRDIGFANLHTLIDESIREAVRCFRHELLLPCLAMLTKALERTWTEMGASLASFGDRAGDPGGKSLRKILEDPLTGLKLRIDKVSDYYRKQLCDPVESASGIKRSAINQSVIWSDEVRDSRNVLHFGRVPSVPMTYERVAVLMLATTGNFRAMYAVKDAADSLP